MEIDFSRISIGYLDTDLYEQRWRILSDVVLPADKPWKGRPPAPSSNIARFIQTRVMPTYDPNPPPVPNDVDPPTLL
jgi:hypothetical protein